MSLTIQFIEINHVQSYTRPIHRKHPGGYHAVYPLIKQLQHVTQQPM